MPNREEIFILLREKFDSRESKIFLLLSLLGIFFILLGIFLTREDFFNKPKIEILNGNTLGDSASKIFIEIAGAVEKPGVYEFNSNSRVDNLLVQAGGLSSQADRVWVEKNINRAALLKDGQKLYIPSEEEVVESGAGGKDFVGTLSSSNASGTITGLVNVNTASLSQLDSLEGIGAVRAQKIIDNRPYTDISELVSRKIIPKGVYEGIKEKITAP